MKDMPRNDIMTKPHHVMAKPHHVMVKPHHIMVKPHHIMVKPHHIMTKPHHIMMKPHHIMVKAHHVMTNDHIRKLWLSIQITTQNNLKAIFCVAKNYGMEHFLICKTIFSFYLCFYTSLLSITEHVKLIFTSIFQRKSSQDLII